MLQIDASLGALVLPDPDGNEIKLSDLWRERPAVIVWIRHYR